MQLLTVLAVLALLVVAQADVGFYVFQGFQTKNASDTFYLDISFTTDRGVVGTARSAAMKFDSKFNVTVPNADKYVIGLNATLYQVGNISPLATLAIPQDLKLLSYNFYLIAYTNQYDPTTGSNTPKLSYDANANPGSAHEVMFMGANYFFAPGGSPSTYTPPSYSVYFYPSNKLYVTNPSYKTELAQTGMMQSGASNTNSLLYADSPEETHEWCSGAVCATAKSPFYVGSSQGFFVVYYGNYYFNDKVGITNFAVPPKTLVAQ